MEKAKCENCKKEIKNTDNGCYARESNVYICSLDCLTDYAHEYLGCVPIEKQLKSKQTQDLENKE